MTENIFKRLKRSRLLCLRIKLGGQKKKRTLAVRYHRRVSVVSLFVLIGIVVQILFHIFLRKVLRNIGEALYRDFEIALSRDLLYRIAQT